MADAVNDEKTITVGDTTVLAPQHGAVYKKRWTNYIWDSFDKSPEERRLLHKLDSTLLTAASLGVLIKFIDQSSVNNAFVSGMKEDLSMYGNELNYAAAFFAAGYVASQIPSNLLLSRQFIKPHYYVPILEVLWSIATFSASTVKTVNHLYVCRFFLGFFEGGHFPAVMYIASSWYTKEELGKRLTLIQIAVGIGPMFAGFLQAAAYNGLNGVSGRPGWQWLFLIDGIISLPIALLAFLFLPDLPVNQSPSWLFTAPEIALAKLRKPLESFKRPEDSTLSLRDVKRILGTWELYGFATLFVLLGIILQPVNSMAYWLKGWNTIKPGSYTVAQINVYPTPIYAVNTLYALAAAWSSDTWLKKRRWPPIVLAFLLNIATSTALGALPVWSPHKSVRWGLYYMTNVGLGCFGILWAWQASATEGDPVKRAVVGANMNGMSTLMGAWFPIVAFPTNKQPEVKVGNFVTAGLAGAGLVSIAAILWLEERDRKRGKKLPEAGEEKKGGADSVEEKSIASASE